ncbi:MAG: DUF3093 domain-containing protein [Actinomycetota bacterium]|nr:DUF3093 domain-containing protein [Actinomycetota bacterium]
MPERPAPQPDFTERLTVPWWWWPVGVAIATLLAAEVHLGQPGLRAWLPYALSVPSALLVLLWLGRHRVRVAAGELHVGPAHLPLQYVGRVTTVRAQDKRQVLGPELDPAAFVLHRPWVGPAVRVELTDPADPTPYWLFSVRDCERLAELLRQHNRDRSAGHHVARQDGCGDAPGNSSCR